ncbi:hypothetical protein [Pseudomonas baetica]|uniref:hypothetical protein n=1 Tax=Pseudomonas baetica TaxID=674054 RepID=UPI002406F1B1|nr:hypothetical protein [Pseudomonas baetica]MDF9778847.1 hypothetical protein [Pseudomonas baetica]
MRKDKPTGHAEANHQNLDREAVESLLNNPPGHPDAVKAREDLLAQLSMAEQIPAAEPSETALRRAMLYLKRCDTGCNEVQTLRQLVMSAQNQRRSITGHVSAYTPGMNLVEVRLPKSEPIPAWLELGENVSLVEIPALEVNDEQ